MRRPHLSFDRAATGGRFHYTSRSGSLRVLVAEDDQITSKATCAILRGLGHQPIPTFDAVQALITAMRAPQPDAIILDLNMPGGNGMGALDKLKSSSKTAEIPVIVVSGITDPNTKQAALDAGAAAYFYKPASPEQIQSALDAISKRADPSRA